MIEGVNETEVKNSKIPDGFNFDNLIATVLVQMPLLLYFVCRRGSWVHKNNRGKKHPPLDPRGIIIDREIDCRFFAKFQLNNSKKDSHLVRVMSRKKWKKSMHAMPAKYCELATLGKKLYLYLKRKGMVQYIENNYSTGNNKDFVNKFVAKFNLKLPEDGEIEKINKNQRKRIKSHRQERNGDSLLREDDPEEEINNFSLAISNVKFQDFSMMNKFSRSLYDEVIETYNFSDNQVLALLSEEYQTILDIIKNHRITSMGHTIAIKAKLIELNNLKIIEEDLINGSKAWRLKNY
ncbi:MAG: hypothetical protein CEE42_11815 [Promethearchaeota archaeon Loki_b31]|nr:MAG: hypothetical protein CEE42_11815 [Candidatus Lokiarchaeota archaeon Loki_b31]